MTGSHQVSATGTRTVSWDKAIDFLPIGPHAPGFWISYTTSEGVQL